MRKPREAAGHLPSHRTTPNNHIRLWLEALETRDLPSALFVTSTADSGAGSLRNAIASAVNGDVIGFKLPSPSTIHLTSGTLNVSQSITIAGPGPSALTIAGNGAFEIFSFTGSNDSLSGLTVTGGGTITGSSGGGISAQGTFALSNCVVTQNQARIGGGIYSGGHLTISDSVVSSNVASEQGAGLYLGGYSASITRTTITNNQAISTDPNIAGLGGGIANTTLLTLEGSIVSNNLALGSSLNTGSVGQGGGIYNNTPAWLTVINSTISGNMAEGQAIDNNPGRDGDGGGIWNALGALTVIGSTISHNFAGGASSRNSTGAGNASGGGVGFASGTPATFTNCTIVANTAQGGDTDGTSGGFADSGGLAGGQLNLTNCTISQNSAIAGSVQGPQPSSLGGGIEFNTAVSNSMRNCIVTANAATIGPDTSFFNGTADFNLIGNGSDSNIANGPNGNQVGSSAAPINPKLGPLQNNGGATRTCALLPGSPAIDNGTNNGITFATDQRGFDRFANVITDIGAFEYQPIHRVAVGAGFGMAPEVKVYDPTTGTLKMDFLAYESTFHAGVRVAVADMNGDGVPDIITAPAGVKVTLVLVNGALTPSFDVSAGRAPEVKVFSGADGSVLADFNAYTATFKAGIFVAVADINGDGKPDIITAPDATGMSGHTNVRVFFNGNNTGVPNREFNAYNPGFGGGVRIAAGDINGDGAPDVITAPGIWSGPDIRVFNGRDLAAGTPPGMIGEILAYDSRYFGGVFVAAGDVNGDGRMDIITGTNGNGGPEVKAFNGATVGIGTPPPQVLDDFFAYDPAFNGGSTVALVDVNGDGRADIVTGAGPGGGPHVRIFNGGTGLQLTDAFDSFMAFNPSFSGGVFVGAA